MSLQKILGMCFKFPHKGTLDLPSVMCHQIMLSHNNDQHLMYNYIKLTTDYLFKKM